jgi:DNA ligase (NAD+)
MVPENEKRRHGELVSEIRRHSDLYYRLASPEISDHRYDALFDELLALEKQYPELASPDSPSGRIGSDLDNAFPEMPHPEPMLSLDKVYAMEELLSWMGKTGDDLSFSVEEKIDGSTIVLHYADGVLMRAVTRGDGYVGNEVTHNVRTIGDVPLRLKEPVSGHFRGEIYIEKADFERFNRETNDTYANPRNFAAGSLRRKKSREVAAVPLRSFVYEGAIDGVSEESHLGMLWRLHLLGFRVGPIGFCSPSPSIAGNHEAILNAREDWRLLTVETLPAYIQEKRGLRDGLAYEIDGLVLKVDRYALRRQLGATAHHPRWAMAYKFEAPQAVSTILDIDVQVGRTGRITPVARIRPVRISGSTISNVTLHNQDYITGLNAAVGDRVAVSRRGDVIPAVEDVLEKNGEGNERYTIPSRCPVCGTAVVQEGAHHFCPNTGCPARSLGRLLFFVGRGQMDIESMGPETVKKLVEMGLISDVSDIYFFDTRALLDEEGFGEKKVSLIEEGIAKSREKPFPVVLAALGLEDVGPRIVELLMDAGFRSVDDLIDAAERGDTDVFTAIQGIGPKTAARIVSQLTDPAIRYTIGRLREAGLNLGAEGESTVDLPPVFEGQVWCVTGSFDRYAPRERAMEEVKRRGGRVTSSVTGRTTHLLAGRNPGGKLERARELGVTVVSEEEFLAMVSP